MKIRSNTIDAVFRYIQQELNSIYNKEEVRQLIYRIFNYLFDMDAAQLLLNKHERLSESELVKIVKVVKQLKSEKPWEYIVLEAEFCGLKFYVNEDVLIPRPETEELVLLVKSDLDKFTEEPFTLMDIGTGSGCIAITLAKSFSKSIYYVLDFTEAGLKVAKKNASIHGVELNALQVDLRKPSELSNLPKTDVIVSNPPYVLESDRAFMKKNVLAFEPDEALFVKHHDPVYFYRIIAGIGKHILNRNGFLYFEINEACGQEVTDMLRDQQYADIKLFRDINEKYRFVKARLFS